MIQITVIPAKRRAAAREPGSMNTTGSNRIENHVLMDPGSRASRSPGMTIPGA